MCFLHSSVIGVNGLDSCKSTTAPVHWQVGYESRIKQLRYGRFTLIASQGTIRPMKLKVYFPKAAQSTPLDKLAGLLPSTVELIDGTETAQPADCDVLVHGYVQRTWLDASPSLQAVIVPFAGVPLPTRDLLRDFPAVTLHNLHYNDIPTAEFAITLMLSAAKFVVPLDQKLRRGDWTQRFADTPTAILAGKRALILGFGAIGRRIAPVCQALGMDVIGIKRTPPRAPIEAGVTVHTAHRLHDLLPTTDVLFCVLPETIETTGLIGARELALLPHDAIVVNVGRGPVVDEEALYNALRADRIKAAGLDVWYNYPEDEAERTDTLPSRFPFHELENVVMSPHRAGWLSASESVRLQALAELLLAAAEGRPMPNLVDKTLGY